VLPGVVTAELVLARTEDTALTLSGFRAYPTGVAFRLDVLLRHDDAELQLGDVLFHRGPALREGQLRAEILRFGVLLADGGRATNLGGPVGMDEPEPPVLTQGGGGGGGRRWHAEQWLWPLPPPGPLVFVCEWPVRGIAETRVEVDAGPIREAAERAETLWPPEPGEGDGGERHAGAVWVVETGGSTTPSG
jgi:hypothetical protein